MASRISLSSFLEPILRSRWPYLLLTVLSAICFAPALNNPYYFDDLIVLRDNAWIHQTSVPWIWLKSFYLDSNHLFSGYRPTLMFSFWINHFLGDSPFGFRAGNLLLHLANSIFLVVFLRRLPDRYRPADWMIWSISTLFLLHPAQTLAINFLWKRSSILVTCIVLAALSLHVRERSRKIYRRRTVFFQVVLFFLAITAKESGLILLPLLLTIDILFFGAKTWKTKPGLYLYAILLLSTGLFLWFRLDYVQEWLRKDQYVLPNRRYVPQGSYIFQQLEILPQYIGVWLYPRPLLLDDPMPLSGIPWKGIVSTGVICVLSILTLIRFHSQRLILFSIALFWIALVPTISSSLFLVQDQIRLYLPLVALSTILIYLVSLFPSYLQTAGIAFLLLTYSSLTLAQNLRYQDPTLIWEDVTRAYPNSGLAWEGLGAALQNENRFGDAASSYRMAAQVEPGNHIYAVDALYCDQLAGRPLDELREEVRKISIQQLDARRIVNLAIVEARIQDFKMAEEHFRNAIELKPTFGLAHYNLGNLLEHQGRIHEAWNSYEQALQLMPDHTTVQRAVDRIRSKL